MTTVETGARDAPRAPRRVRLRATPDLVLRVVVLAVAMLPVVAVLVTRVGRTYFPVQDPASIDLLVRDVFTSNTPLVGAYSRGFNHPGPLYFYALAPLSRLTGGATWATMVGAALVQGIAIVGIAWVAIRRGGTAFMLLMLAALGLAYAGLDQGGQFTHAWNPFAALPAFVLFLLAAWGVVVGDRWQAVVAVAAGSFVVQCHIGYAPLVLAAAVWAVVRVLADRPPGNGRARWATVLAWTAGVGLLLWLPPIIEEIRDRPGNLSAIWDFFRAGGSTLGLRTGAGLFATEFRWFPPWLGGHEEYGYGTGNASPSSVWWLLLPAALVVVAYLAARRRGHRGDQRLVELAAVTGVVTVITLSRITIDPLPYVFYFRVTAATFLVAACGWAIVRALPRAWAPWPRRVGITLTAIAVVVGFGVQTKDVLDHTDRLAGIEAASEDVLHQVRAEGYPRQPVLVRALGSTLGGLDQGVIDALDRAGAPVRVDPQFGYHFGDHRTATPSEVDEIWYVAEEGRYTTLLPEIPGARVVASSSPLSRADERELRALQRDAIDALRASGHDDLVSQVDNRFFDLVMKQEFPDGVPGLTSAKVRRIAELNTRVALSDSCRCVIVAFPAAEDPELPFSIG